MSAFDIRLNKKITVKDTFDLITDLFSIPQNNIWITDEITGEENLGEIKILCVFEESAGDFPIFLNINNYIEKQGIGNEKELAIKVAMYLDCDVLIANDIDPGNPYLWDIVDKMGEVKSILVDADALDEKGEFYIKK